MVRESDGSDPAWKGLMSWGTLGAIVLGFGFWFFIAKPTESQNAALSNLPGMAATDLNLCTQQILMDIDNKEPMKLLKSGQVDDAVGEARHLIDKDKWNVINLMVAGDVFAAVPKNKTLNEEGYGYLLTSIYMCPQSKYIKLNYARALVRGGRIEEATKQYDKIVSSTSEPDIMPTIELARLYLNNGDEDKAVKLLDAVVKKDGDNSAARKMLGIAMARNHNEKEGYEEFLKAYGQEAMVGFPEHAKEVFERNNSSLPDATKEQKAIVDSTPDDVEPKLVLAELLLMQRDFNEAKSLLDAAKAKQRSNPEVHRILVELYHLQAKEDLAYQEWLTATKLDKESGT